MTLLLTRGDVAPDPLSGLLALATVSVVLLWRLNPLSLMAGGAAVGVVLRSR
ncbi:MAG: hypothetical protein ACREJY_01505 [Candidatus Rokuibacteriota bacterium]